MVFWCRHLCQYTRRSGNPDMDLQRLSLAGLHLRWRQLPSSYWSARYIWYLPLSERFVWPAFTSGDASCPLPIGQLAIFGTLLLVTFLSGRPSPQVTPVALFLLVSSLFWHPPIGYLFVWPVFTSSDSSCNLPIGQLAIWHHPIGKLFVWPVLNLFAPICSPPIDKLAIWHRSIGKHFVWPVLNPIAPVCILCHLAIWHPPLGKFFVWPVFNLSAPICGLKETCLYVTVMSTWRISAEPSTSWAG